MAVSHQGTYVQLPGLGLVQILIGDTTARKTLVTGGTNGSKVTAISMTCNETGAARDVQFWVARGGVFYLLDTVTAPITSGSVGTTPPVNVLSNWTGLPLDNDGQKYFYLASADVLSAASLITMSAGKELDVMAVYGDF